MAARACLGSLPAAALAVALLLSAITPAPARDLTGPERQSLVATVQKFEAAMRAKDVPVIIAIVPPRMLKSIAEQHNVPLDKLREAMVAQTVEVMKAAEIQTFRMDAGKIRYLSTPTGTPYGLVPTEVSMKVAGQTIASSAESLAMMDEGTWYLLDLNETEKVALFTKVYPDFANADLGGKKGP